MSKNIVLIGLMGSGKTTIGKMLADKLNMEFADTDDLIVRKAGKPIKLIFADEGEEVFRDIESEIIEAVSQKQNIVISTGGGAVLREENVENLKKNGILFHLYASAEELFERIKGDSERPLLNTQNPVETLKIILEKREIFYSVADFKINTGKSSTDKAVEEIITLFASC